MASKTAAPTTGNPRVSLTAYATASAWADFGFEHAEWFDTRRGRALYRPLHWICRALRPVWPGAGAFTQTLYWRHRWFTDWAERQRPSLAVEIGAGLSTRGIAFARRHPRSHWIDYDLADLVAARRRRLAGRPLPANYTLTTGDLLAPGLGEALRAPGDGRVIALTEGVTDYLDAEEKQRAWHAIAALLKRLGGGRYLLEVHPRERLPIFGPASGLMRDALRRITRRDLFGQLCENADDAIERLIAAGFVGARVLPEDELAESHRAPAPEHRAFVLVEAWT